MSDTNPIPKAGDPEVGTPYELLRSEGLKYIENLAGKLWTDYNTHDPGVTILELLSYAITDLEYRISMPVGDLLAKPEENAENMHRQFLSAIRALPCRPVSANDYRQIFVRLFGVRNAWILRSDHIVVARYQPSGAGTVTELRYKKPGEVIDPDKEVEFTLQGINRILVDFDRSAMPFSEDAEDPDGALELLEMAEKQKIKSRVKEVYHRFRNLCEDLDTIEEVPVQGVVICGDIDIEPMADPEAVWARIVFNIDSYLSPEVNLYTLQEMQEMGKTTDEIFEGPVYRFDDEYAYRSAGNPFVKKGFIADEELVNSELRTEVRLSDIIRIIMETEGVKLVKELEFGLCDCAETDMDQVRSAIGEGKWNLCIAPGHKPLFCTDNSVLNFWKELIPIDLKEAEARMKLRELRQQHQAAMREAVTADIPMPDGRFREPGQYTTIQNDFPEVYGIGPEGLPDSATVQRKAQAKQLKGYLLFFDQILGNYFSQLAHAGELLSSDPILSQTYFSNVISGLKDSADIFTTEDKWISTAHEVLREAALDPWIARRNRFLDHLLARFAEHFNEYVFLMYRLYAEDAGQAVIRHKAKFLQQYETLGSERGQAFDYYNPGVADPLEKNVTGMEKRVSGLLGFNTFRHIPLSELPYQIITTGTVTKMVEGVPTDFPIFGWNIHKTGEILLEGTRTDFLKKAEALELMGRAAILGIERRNYGCELSANKKKVTILLFTSSGEKIAKYPLQVAVLPGEAESGTYSQAETVITKIMNFLTNEFKTEGIYVVEHLLLRPGFETPPEKHALFFHVCLPKENIGCVPIDPYSFRATFVLPGYSARLRNPHFRRFAERLIRMETPAHIMPRICFVNEEFMKRFEEAWNAWLSARESSPDPAIQAPDPLLLALKAVLEEMFTVYQEGQLTDCDDDTPEQNPVVLGTSSLGSLETTPDNP